jgi:hypothetical protein
MGRSTDRVIVIRVTESSAASVVLEYMPQILALISAPIGVVVAIVIAVRRARASGSIRTRREACQQCGKHGPVLEVHYHQNTGMLVMRRSRHVHALLCRSCSTTVFGKMTLHNLVAGWWGTISAIVTPFFILNNIGYVLLSSTLPSAGASTSAALEVQRQYALNLLATKDVETVVGVLVQLTGASEADVRAFVSRLRNAA